MGLLLGVGDGSLVLRLVHERAPLADVVAITNLIINPTHQMNSKVKLKLELVSNYLKQLILYAEMGQ